MISYEDYVKYAEEFKEANHVTQEHADKCDKGRLHELYRHILKKQKDNND